MNYTIEEENKAKDNYLRKQFPNYDSWSEKEKEEVKSCFRLVKGKKKS